MNDKRLENAIQLIKQGDKRNAGILLQELVKENPNNLQARQAIEQMGIETPPLNTVVLPKSTVVKDERRFDKATSPKPNKNWPQILLAGSVLLLSLSVCILALFVVFTKGNYSFAVPSVAINTPTDSPEKIYVNKMSQNMILLDSFNFTFR